jgi:regulator of protease activity HflC (stomatin/prohibitin superfamily)
MLWKRIIVGDQERALITKNGRFGGILMPGEYRLFTLPGVSLNVEKYNVRDLVFQSTWADYLALERPDVAERHFTRVETNDLQVAMIYVDRKLFKVMLPAKRMLFWRGAVDVTAEVVNVIDEPSVPAQKLPALERLGKESLTTFCLVEEAKVGLLYIDNRLVRTLPPGKYGFWAVTGSPRVDIVDLRRQTIEVPGQEILSRDKVSLRVNILAEYQVKDAVKAKQTIANFEAYFYRLLQLSMRQALGRKTLEEILAEKTEVDEATASAVRTEMGALGVEVGAIALKDIILPGEMREIMNQVVSAEKQAQANLIRRREETAATRSLLNTAKLLEDNPILVRLKELETLEKLVEKVDRLTVTGGFEGLLDNLIEIRKPVGVK